MSQTPQRNDFESRRSRLVLVLAALALCLPHAGAAEEPAAEGAPTREWNPRSRPFRPMAFRETVENGYLFLDGEYIASPYEFEFRDGEAWLKDRDISAFFPVQPPRGDSARTMENGPWAGRGRYPGGQRMSSRHVLNALNQDGAAVLFTNERPVTLNAYDAERLFEVLLQEENRPSDGDLSWLPRGSNQQSFSEWIASYQLPETLRERLEQKRARQQSMTDESTSQRDAARRLDQWDYPLTVLGMVLVVAAFGHLMSRRPAAESSAEKINLAPDAIRQTNWSLLLVAAMSAMDLIWTILIHQAGAMKELNPFGSRLLEDPFQLMVFKISLTALAVGLIFGLRRYRRAQEASWWGCLLLTVLTVRWLTLNSLFV